MLNKKMHIISVFMVISILLSLVVLPIGFQVRAATDYYLSPTGSDSNDGSIGSPWKTLAKAIPYLRAGDTLYARAGTYKGQNGVFSTYSGNSSAPITFKAYPGEIPIFDGQNSKAEALDIMSVSYIVIDGITFKNYTNTGIWMGWEDDVTKVDATHNTVQNCTIQHIGGHLQECDHGIYISYGNKNVTIRNNEIDDCFTGAGIHFYHTPACEYADIYNNVISNCAWWGIVIGGGAQKVSIYNNTLYKNGESAAAQAFPADHPGNISISDHEDTALQNITIKNNISFSSYNGAGLEVGERDAPSLTEDNNLWFSTDGKPILWNDGSGYNSWTVEEMRVNTANAINSIEIDPQFADMAGNNFHLTAASPCVDAGQDSVALINDFDGNTRPQGLHSDIGAYEYLVMGSMSEWNSAVYNLRTGNIGNISSEFDLIPVNTSVSGLIGYTGSSAALDGEADLPMIITLDSTAGYFKVRNGIYDVCLQQVNYQTGVRYHFRIVPNLIAKTYDVFVTPENGVEVMIAQNYAFQAVAPEINDMGRILLKSDTNNAFEVENHEIHTISLPSDPVQQTDAINLLEGQWGSKPTWEDGIHDLGMGNTESLAIEFDLIMNDNQSNVTVGYTGSSSVITGWSDLSMIIQMASATGYFEVRNGSEYECLEQVRYTNGTKYHFRIIPDFSTKTYDVFVTPADGTELLIADNYAFRSNAPEMNDIGKISLKSDVNNSIVVENHVVLKPGQWGTKVLWEESIHDLGTRNTGNVAAEFDLVPVNIREAAVIGYAGSSTEITGWSSLSMIIQMDPAAGYFEVRNGSGYECLEQVKYTNGKKYHFELIPDFSTKTYDVFVTPAGGSKILIASSYAFRSNAPEMNDLGELSLKSNTYNPVYIENHQVIRLDAKELVLNLINHVKGMNIKKQMQNLLVKELEEVKSSLDKGQYKLALVKMKVFMDEVKIQSLKTITKEQTDNMLKASMDICLAILADTQGKDKSRVDKKVNEIMEKVKSFKSKSISEEIYKSIMELINDLINGME